MYITRLSSPVGVLLLAADGIALTGLWMEGQKYFAATLSKDAVEQPDLPVFRQTAQWLSAYFDGAPLPAMPPLAPQGSAFRQARLEPAAEDSLWSGDYLWRPHPDSAGAGYFRRAAGSRWRCGA